MFDFVVFYGVAQNPWKLYIDFQKGSVQYVWVIEAVTSLLFVKCKHFISEKSSISDSVHAKLFDDFDLSKCWIRLFLWCSVICV